MHKNEHLLNTAEFFGGMEVAKKYGWVHDWLDEMVTKGVSILEHRKYRHHEKGLREFEAFARKAFPKADIQLALKIARQHILDDMGFMPRDETEYEKS